jgi:hypothetical protein
MLNERDGACLSWLDIAQVRRTVPDKSRDGWDQFSTPMPLARAVREALEIMSREPVSIMVVRPFAGTSRLGDREIMRLARREDYPYQFVGGQPGEHVERRSVDIATPRATSYACQSLPNATGARISKPADLRRKQNPFLSEVKTRDVRERVG